MAACAEADGPAEAGRLGTREAGELGSREAVVSTAATPDGSTVCRKAGTGRCELEDKGHGCRTPLLVLRAVTGLALLYSLSIPLLIL